MKISTQLVNFTFPLLGALLLCSTTALYAASGPSQAGEICMQKIFGTPVAPSNRLNCTANDISLSRVVTVLPDSCIKGSTFDVEATFEVNVTANGRYDPGFFFRTDGGLNARGEGADATGTCSLSALAPPPPPNAPALQLDGDTCGDLNAGTFNVTFVIPDVECTDSNGNGKLNLPYCTSWHSNQGTVCDIDEAFDFKPDTKSKCVCDDNFELDIAVEDAELSVEKTASPDQVPETGGQVTYTVRIENIAEFESVVIRTIEDDIFGDLADENNPDVTETNCDELVGDTLGPGAWVICTFKAQILGTPGDDHVNEVEVCASQPPSTEPTICGDDDATVDIIDEFEEPTLQKTAQATKDCQVDVDYQVVVSNNSAVDVLTVTDLYDDKFGDITSAHDAIDEFGAVLLTSCDDLPQDVDPGENYTCYFTGRIVDANCSINHTNVVTADTVDDDEVPSDPSDDATVTLSTEIVTPGG